jgi:hypothetical protein
MKNENLASISTLLVAGILALAANTVHAGVIAHWTFEEGVDGAAAVGVDSVTDVSGNGHNGTPFNGPAYETTASGDKGLRFDGFDDRIFVADSNNFAVNSMTVEAVVSLDTLASNPGNLDQIVFRGDTRNGLDPFYLAVFNGNQIRFVVQESPVLGLGLNVDIAGISIGELFHVAGTLDDATDMMKVFINGIEVASATTAARPILALLPAFSPGLGIGNTQRALDNQFFDGVIAEVRLSDVALTPDQFLGADPQTPTPAPAPSTLLLLAAGILARLFRVGYGSANVRCGGAP